jgi:hypothetical protein
MTIKKFLYSIRNWILLIIQFAIPPLFVVITMLSASLFTADGGLPELAISFKEYLQTVTTVEQGTLTAGSVADQIFTSYREMFSNLPDRIPFTSHSLTVTEKNFEEEILAQYKTSKSTTNLNYMVGATFSEDKLTAWFNNQAYHTAPLTINLFNNAILKYEVCPLTQQYFHDFSLSRKFSGNVDSQINLINKPLPYTTQSRVRVKAFFSFLSYLMSFELLRSVNWAPEIISDSTWHSTPVSPCRSSPRCSSCSTSRNASAERSFYSLSVV